MTMAAPNSTTRMAAHVLLAFDDFSFTGRHLLHHFELEAHRQEPLALVPKALEDHVAVMQYFSAAANDEMPKLSIVRVATANLDGDALWQLADALVQFLSDTAVHTLSVVASLHLPQAKPHTELLANVYHGVLHATNNSVDSISSTGDSFKQFDASWEIKDAFLSRFLHFARVEQAFATHLLVMKGYKPGRDGSATREAMQTLAKALALYAPTKGGSVDVQQAMESAYKAMGVASSQSAQPLNLLYQ